MSSAPAIINIHTPSSSFAIVHSLNEEALEALYDKLSRKANTGYGNERVSAGWLKYEWNDSIWNLDDDADYKIFVWRQQQSASSSSSDAEQSSSSLFNSVLPAPTLHLHNPATPLPAPPAYLNPSYYVFQPSRAHRPPTRTSSRPNSTRSRKTKGSKKGTAKGTNDSEDDGVPQFKKDFNKFHGENGVRTVMGSIGPAQNVRMLLKSGYRHVYISRKFAMKHGFIPADAAPGHYGYGGLVNIGTWPITLTPSSSFASTHQLSPPPGHHKRKDKGTKPTLIPVYLSEEPHFDVVLGRSFFERRQIQVSAIDPTDVVCLDTGEKLECELVILKDGKGEIVTVT